MKSILEDIKTQNFKQAYLLYGEEAYLKHQYKNKLKNALLPEDDTMNFSRFEGKGTEIPKVIDLAETMPFFCGPPCDSAGKYRIFQKQSRRAGRLHGIPAGLSGADLRGGGSR